MTDHEILTTTEASQQLARLRAIMHRLRAPGGCPWDAEQSHESIISNLIEEAYETIDAIQRRDYNHLREELGDLLLQVVFHSEISEEAGRFTLDDVAQTISEKLIRRHPHVFENQKVIDTDAVLAQWDEIKRVEKGTESLPYLHAVGNGLPALMRAAKLQKKASKVGFDWHSVMGVIEKVHEELAEFEAALQNETREAAYEELGDLLFSVVNVARFLKHDPELLMAAANTKFEKRFNLMEKILKSREVELDTASAEEMEQAWNESKTRVARS